MGLLGMNEGSGVFAMNFNGEDAEEEPNVSPEEQEEYDMFVTNGLKILYGTKEGEGPVRPEILGRLGQGANKEPMDSLAQTAVWLTMLIENSAQQAGKRITDDVVFQGGRELFSELAEIADAAKIHTYTERELQGAWYKALDMYREVNTRNEENPEGRIDAEQLKAQFAELDEADRAGRGAELIGIDPARAAQEADNRASMEETGPMEDREDMMGQRGAMMGGPTGRMGGR